MYENIINTIQININKQNFPNRDLSDSKANKTRHHTT